MHSWLPLAELLTMQKRLPFVADDPNCSRNLHHSYAHFVIGLAFETTDRVALAVSVVDALHVLGVFALTEDAVVGPLALSQYP